MKNIAWDSWKEGQRLHHRSYWDNGTDRFQVDISLDTSYAYQSNASCLVWSKADQKWSHVCYVPFDQIKREDYDTKLVTKLLALAEQIIGT